jgi:hypothetical protein
MALFKKAEMTSAFLKMGIMGFAGSGKTYTGTLVSTGLVQYMRERNIPYANKPVYFLDTETGSDWVQPVFAEAGIELFTAKTRAFRDLMSAVAEAEQNGSLLMVDSITHFWTEICDAYVKAKNRSRLQFEDWAFLKKEWRKFTDRFVNSNLHIILCGRAGYEYDYFTNDAGKKELEKTGIKMKAEGEMGYEPSLLVLMERETDMGAMKVSRTARILKDRSTRIDGRDFHNPTFKSFLPHIEFLNLGGRQLGVDTERNSEADIPEDAPRDRQAQRRRIVLGDIQDLLVLHIPGMSAADKQRKVQLLRKHFHAGWTEMEEVMPLDDLKAGYITLRDELEPPAIDPISTLDDSIPALEKTEEAEEIDDRTVILHDFEDALAAFPGNSTRIAQLRKSWQPAFESNGFDPAWMAKVEVAVLKAKKAKPVGLKAQLQTSVENERAEAAE